MRKIKLSRQSWINKIRRKNLPAFTLAEILLVLAVVCFVTLLFSGQFSNTLAQVKGELFVLKFERALKDTQASSALLGQPKTIACQDERLIVAGKAAAVPDSVRLSNFSVTFDAKGENSSLQRISLDLPLAKQCWIYQMEMGSGKFKKSLKN